VSSIVPAGEIADVLGRQLNDARASFSIGSLGAIAEFHRRPDETLERVGGASLAAMTARGALRIELGDDVVPLAYETLSGRRGRWQHGVLFCRPIEAATMHRRSVLTELGPDLSAVRDEDRDAILFDIGLGAQNVDFCVRSNDGGLLAVLRLAEGQSIFAPGNPAMAALLDTNPHRIAIGGLGRIEVYQAIPRDTTPEGPHTHVLAKLLKTGRTHSANIAVPKGLMPCLSLYPPHPAVDAMGRAHAYDGEAAAGFDALLRRWGAKDVVAEKDRLTDAVLRQTGPSDYARAATRAARTASRIALRQLACRHPEQPAIAAWLAAFDRPSTRSGREASS